jgi:hypothetical protein
MGDSKTGNDDGGSRKTGVRTRIQASIEEAQEAQRRELFRRRLELARNGVKNYQLKRVTEAVRAFHSYIGILEDWKGTPEGGLTPSHFDVKNDLPELLLISGVYWDLAKLYDRTKSVHRKKEFMHYLGKYILFSKGLPYEAVASETLRKYIATEKPVHMDEFKNAYKVLSGSKCFIATSLIDLTEEATIGRLREFRDRRLRPSSAGRVFIAAYERVSPAFAFLLDRAPAGVRRAAAAALDGTARRVRS